MGNWKTICLAVLCAAISTAYAADLQAPAQVTAGTAFTIPTSGSGDRTFYLVGPSSVVKKSVKLGSEIEIAADQVHAAGRYVAVSCGSEGCSSASFYVVSGSPAKVSFLLHPSRVPVTAHDAINATAFVFDKFHNPVLQIGRASCR